MTRSPILPSAFATASAPEINLFEAQWLACLFPDRRFADFLTEANARLGVDVICYTFIVVDLHHVLLASLLAHCEKSWIPPTMMARAAPHAAPTIVLTSQEITILDHLIGDNGNRGARPGTLQLYITKLARLGGYLARMSDPPPGNTVIWRGLRRMADIQLGTEIGGTGTYG